MLAIIQKAAPFRLLDGTRFHVGAEPLNCIDDHRTGPSRGLDELLPDAIESDLCKQRILSARARWSARRYRKIGANSTLRPGVNSKPGGRLSIRYPLLSLTSGNNSAP
jgi:hypothetical protein